MSTLFLIRGLPGAGKSTLADALCRQHVEADMFFIRDGVYEFDPTRLSEAHTWCQNKARQMLRDGDVVVSNTFTRRWEMAPYLEMGADRVVEVIVNTDLSDEQLAARTVHSVPPSMIHLMRERWEA